MPLLTFTPPVDPSPGTNDSPEIALYQSSFGDGYTQSSPKGLNSIRSKLELRWEGLTVAQARTINDFVRGRGGYIPFYYTHPVENVRRKWICKTWSATWSTPCKFSMTLTEDFTLEA